MRSITIATALALFCAASSAEAAVITAPAAVTYELGIYDMTITPTGATEFTVAAGEAFTIAGDWSATYDPNNGGCFNCIHQLYLAGLAPFAAQVNLYNDLTDIPGTFVPQGMYNQSFNAPLLPGTYYIGGAATLDFDYLPDRIGGPNGSNEVSYIINVKAVPEPATMLLLGTGLAGLVASRRRHRARPE